MLDEETTLHPITEAVVRRVGPNVVLFREALRRACPVGDYAQTLASWVQALEGNRIFVPVDVAAKDMP